MDSTLFLNTISKLESVDPQLISAIKKAFVLCEADSTTFGGASAVPGTGKRLGGYLRHPSRNSNEFMDGWFFDEREGNSALKRVIARSAKRKFNNAHSPENELNLEVGGEEPDEIESTPLSTEMSDDFFNGLNDLGVTSIEDAVSAGYDALNSLENGYNADNLHDIAKKLESLCKVLRSAANNEDAKNGIARSW